MEIKITKKRLRQTIILILLILILVYMFIISIRLFVIAKHNEAVAKYNQYTNMYKKITSYNKNGLTITKVYIKDEKALVNVNINNNEKIITYYENIKTKEAVKLSSEEGKKIATAINTNNTPIPHLQEISSLGSEDSFDNLIASITTTKISTDICNNKECYLLENISGGKTWIDKETLLTVRDINSLNKPVNKDSNVTEVIDSQYKLDCVTDEEVELPDLMEYEF